MWYVTRGMGHMGGVVHFLKILALAAKLFKFRIDSVLKIQNERITEYMHEWMNELLNDGGEYRRTPATSRLLKTFSLADF